MKSIKAALLSPKEESNPTTEKQRLSKPLPIKPLPTPPSALIIDETSRHHIAKLILSWLHDLKIPIKPWANVLNNIAIDILQKLLNNHTSNGESTKQICMEMLYVNAPKDSRFLANVMHGSPIQDGEHTMHFPIGGTIRIYGLNANDETCTKTLIELVHTLVYLTYSLYLETFVMRDSHVKSVLSTTTITPNAATATESNQADSATQLDSQHAKKTTDATGLFGWLRRLAPISRDRPPSPPSPSIDSEKTIRRKSNPLTTTVRRGLSLNNLSKELQSSAATTTPPPTTTPAATTLDALPFDMDAIQEGDPHRFSKLKKRIEFALISSSPECHFPCPNLLNRLEAEQDVLIEQKRRLMLQEEYMTTRAQPVSRQQQSVKRAVPPQAEQQLPQSITAYSSVRVPTLLADSRNGLEHLLLDTTSLHSFKQHQSITIGFTCYPIGCPDRPCLGPLMSKMDYFRYKSPVDSTSTTLFPSIDQSLGHTIRHWCHQSQSSCQLHIEEQAQFIPTNLMNNDMPNPVNNSNLTQRPETLLHRLNEKPSESSIYTLATPLLTSSSSRSSSILNQHRQCSKFHGCQQPLLDHIFSFAHGVARINVYASTESTCVVRDKDKIVTWLVCSVCDASTTPRVLSHQAASFSFAKYLELLFYSTRLASPASFCAHATHRHAINRCFLHHGIVFKFTYEEANYYELRVPRIQIAPEALVSDKLTFAAPRVGVSTLLEWKHKSAERDVDLFFQSIRAHLDLLHHYTLAESRRKTRSLLGAADTTTTAKQQQLQSESRALDVEIRGLSKRLDTDHQAMLHALADTSLNELNDFRRYFAIQSESIIQYLTDWQQLQCDEVTDVCGWDSPDYISQKTVHCFPGSSVLVRQDEPTSIIAYSLSSNDYIQEILHDEGAAAYQDSTPTASSSSKNPSLPSLSSTNTTESSRTIAEAPPPMPITHASKKRLPQLPNIIDGYYSSIERKYISPSTGATSETASFRTMITEVVKSSVVEASIHNSKRLEELKARLSPWTQKQEETKLEGADLKRDLTERTLKPPAAVQQQQEETREVKVASYFYENADQQQSVEGKKKISPHIKHKFVHEGIEFTCIIYYAKEFEMLRRQCNINQLMIESLCRCQTWTASGGKSKSHFYKTQDDRFVIKEMMNAWNVAEKDAFLKFAPKYFDHVGKSANEPSVLAKIFGFFTIRMKNAADKKSLLNLDVLVMEHLFFNQNIIKRFDFKGIQDRHVEEFRKQQQDTTLWDGDWLNEYRTRLPVHEQSKSTMELAIRNDTDFLSRCNIMDYSLLVGIDQSNAEMTAGIVDFIGAYTWYKKLESKSKSTLQPKKEVTVVPPDQYKHRFCREVCDYFIAVPGKFDLVTPSKCLPSLLI